MMVIMIIVTSIIDYLAWVKHCLSTFNNLKYEVDINLLSFYR